MTPQLNWENIDAKFVPPMDLSSLRAVPLLAETLARVVVPAGQQQALAAITADRTHGAAELAVWVLDALEGALYFIVSLYIFVNP